MDASLRVEVRELVAQLQREAGVTTLFVTHDQEEATVLADRVALMLDGRLEQVGTPRELYERPATLAVARFFGTANAFDGVVADGCWRGALGAVPYLHCYRTIGGLLAVNFFTRSNRLQRDAVGLGKIALRCILTRNRIQ